MTKRRTTKGRTRFYFLSVLTLVIMALGMLMSIGQISPAM